MSSLLFDHSRKCARLISSPAAAISNLFFTPSSGGAGSHMSNLSLLLNFLATNLLVGLPLVLRTSTYFTPVGRFPSGSMSGMAPSRTRTSACACTHNPSQMAAFAFSARLRLQNLLAM